MPMLLRERVPIQRVPHGPLWRHGLLIRHGGIQVPRGPWRHHILCIFFQHRHVFIISKRVPFFQQWHGIALRHGRERWWLDRPAWGPPGRCWYFGRDEEDGATHAEASRRLASDASTVRAERGPLAAYAAAAPYYACGACSRDGYAAIGV